jgi:voltage-gated potassium channel Kch
LCEQVAAAAILIRDDVAALRYALALAHLDPSLPLIVTIFDETIASQLRKFLPQAKVSSPATLAVPSLAGPCLEAGLLASFLDVYDSVEVRCDEGVPSVRRCTPRSPCRRSRLIRTVRWAHWHHDAGTRLLLIGLLGLGAILLADWSWLVLVERHGIAESFVEAARVVATVGPAATNVDEAYAIGSALAMLVTIVLTALFTAGLVERFLEPRLLALLGSRTPPRKDHVIVVGMGQVGLRLCAQLRARHIPVVGVERDRRAPHLSLARRMGIPVLIGSGSERRLLEKLRLSRCLALAAVGSDDLDNIAVAVAAAAVSAQTRVVLRAGEHEAIAETRSLLPLGVIRDVTEIAATFVVAVLLGRDVRGVVAGRDTMHLLTKAGECEPFMVSGKEECRHTPVPNG